MDTGQTVGADQETRYYELVVQLAEAAVLSLKVGDDPGRALWRLVDAAGLLRTGMRACGGNDDEVGTPASPTGRGFYIGDRVRLLPAVV